MCELLIGIIFSTHKNVYPKSSLIRLPRLCLSLLDRFELDLKMAGSLSSSGSSLAQMLHSLRGFLSVSEPKESPSYLHSCYLYPSDQDILTLSYPFVFFLFPLLEYKLHANRNLAQLVINISCTHKRVSNPWSGCLIGLLNECMTDQWWKVISF